MNLISSYSFSPPAKSAYDGGGQAGKIGFTVISRADGDGLLNHQKDNLIPKTNNLAENKNRPIKRRFTPLDDLNK